MEKMFRLMRRCKKNAHLRKIWMTMKLTIVLFILAISQLMAVGTYSQSTRLSLNLKTVAVKDVLDKIEANSEFVFLYNSKLIDVDRTVSMDFRNEKISEILNKLFQETDVSYTVVDRQIVLTTKADQSSFSRLLNGQQGKVVSGKVTDSSGGSLPGVSVVIKGTTNGSITDPNGNYSVGNIPANSILQFSFVGMKMQEIEVDNKSVINIVMQEETIGIEEVMAIGYGVQKKNSVTGAISSVKAEDMQNTSITRPEQILQGKTAGVQVIPISGSPGAGMNVRIRGYSSNANSNPIFIVDGVKTQDIGYLDPNDIASMDILKDASSAAIYGAEGGNGVVMITTKGGQKGKTLISYEVQHSWQSAGNLPKLMDVNQYAQYMKEGGIINNVDKTYNTDWLKEIMETGSLTKHHISMTGGNDKSVFLLSLGYMTNDGIIKGSQDKFKRYSIRLNSDHEMKSWLKVGNHLSYAHTDRSAINETQGEFGGVISSALQIDPATPVSFQNNIPAYAQAIINANPSVLKDPNGNYYGISQYNFGEIVNPFVTMAITNGGIYQDNLNGDIYAEITPITDLTFTTRYGVDINYQNNHFWRPTYYYTAERNNGSTVVVDQNQMNNTWIWENFVSYKKSIQNHNFVLLAGMSAEDYYQRVTNVQGGPMVKEDPSFAYLSFLSGQTNDLVTGNPNYFKKESQFGRVTYDYMNKYMFQGSIRRDGASLSYVPKSGRWGIFPSFSGGWVISSEDFFNKTILSYAKLRGSWGQNGSLSNLLTTPYGYLPAITAANTGLIMQYPLSTGNSPAFEPAVAPNPNLKWETSQQTDIGVDLRAFKDKLTFTADYYVKTTKDLITLSNPPLEVGNNPAQINAGTVENKGFEFELGYKEKIGDFKYSANVNLSTLKNNVTYLDPTVGQINGAQVGPSGSWYATVFEQGHSMWHFNGYKTAGIDPATGNPIFVKKDGTKTNAAGITGADLQDIGSPLPKLLFGANINLAYKAFDLTVSASGMSGNKVMMAWIRTDRNQINRPTYFFDGRWTAAGQNTKIPGAGADSKTYNSDQIVFNGSYLRIQQIQLGYTLPTSMADKFSIKSLRIYVSMDNFFTFTKYPGMDPQPSPQYTSPTTTLSNSVGIDRGTYPIPRDIMVGASISF